MRRGSAPPCEKETDLHALLPCAWHALYWWHDSCVCVCMHAQLLFCVQLFKTLWTVAQEAPLSRRFSGQTLWSGLLCPPPGHLPDPGIEPMSHVSCIGGWVLYHWRRRRVCPTWGGSSPPGDSPFLCIINIKTSFSEIFYTLWWEGATSSIFRVYLHLQHISIESCLIPRAQ